jgi:voltage-gated potassium channel
MKRGVSIRLWIEVAMGGLALVSVWQATQPDSDAHHAISLWISVIFGVEYLLRLLFAPRKLEFMRNNVLDLVAIMPIDLMRAARLFRLVRVLRLVRGIGVLWRSGRHISGILNTNGLAYALAITTAVVLACGLVIGQVEPTIRGPEDGIWWSLVTATTVGYGDIAPHTQEGRLIAVFLMIIGIGTTGMITGSIATYFLGSRGSKNSHVRHVQRQLDLWDDLTREERAQVVRVLASIDEGPVAGGSAGGEVGAGDGR